MLFYFDKNPEASGLYPYSTAECLMRLARKTSLPSLPPSLTELANLFDEGHLLRYSCCNEIMFKGCVRDVDGQASIIFSCTTLLQLVLANNIEEIRYQCRCHIQGGAVQYGKSIVNHSLHD